MSISQHVIFMRIYPASSYIILSSGPKVALTWIEFELTHVQFGWTWIPTSSPDQAHESIPLNMITNSAEQQKLGHYK